MPSSEPTLPPTKPQRWILRLAEPNTALLLFGEGAAYDIPSDESGRSDEFDLDCMVARLHDGLVAGGESNLR